VAGVALHLGAADTLHHQDLVVGPYGLDGKRALLDESRPSVRAGDGELPYVLGTGASPRDTAIAQVQTQEVRISALVDRISIAAGASSLMFRAGSAPDAGTPLLDGADRNADLLGNNAVDQALLGQLQSSVHRSSGVHKNSVASATDIFGYANLPAKKCRKRDSNPHALSSRRF